MGGKDAVLDRLTNPSFYTGSHVHRFDEHGRGRGIAGRDRIIKGSGTMAASFTGDIVTDLSQITRSEMRASTKPPTSARNSKPGDAHSTGLNRPQSARGSSRTSRCSEPECSNKKSPTSLSGYCSFHSWKLNEDANFPKCGEVNSSRSSKVLKASSTNCTPSSNPGKARSGNVSVLERLTNPQLFTGTHTHRFDPRTGKGRGLAGRDSAAKASGGHSIYRGGQVSDLSQILRT